MTSFYDTHAEEFSKSRYSIWRLVKEFLNSLPPHSTVLDIGCGNGKNMLYRADINMIGVEYSNTLVKICKSRNLQVVQGDARSLPFRSGQFDAIIMIAVLHHILPAEQLLALTEIRRVLRGSGRCLLTNWAVEQPARARREFVPGLNIVQWKGCEDVLSYWVMNEEMAKEFAANLPEGLTCKSLELDLGNWTFCLENNL